MAKNKGKATATPDKVKQQQEAAAALKAEKALTPADEPTETVIPAPKPLTLAEKLRKVDDEIADMVRAKKLTIAKEAARDAKNAFEAYLDDCEDETLTALRNAVRFADRQVREFGGDTEQPQASTAASNGTGEEGAGGFRVVGKPKEDAKAQVMAVIKENHAMGAKASDFEGKISIERDDARLLLNEGQIRKLVNELIKEKKAKKEGDLSASRYRLA